MTEKLLKATLNPNKQQQTDFYAMKCINFQSTAKVKELQDQLNITLAKTHRKVNSLKSQFIEHKKKWETVSTIKLLKIRTPKNLL